MAPPSLEDATWHYHGVFRAPEGADVLISTDDGGAILYIDRVSTPGTLVVAALDPMYHFGSYFMPATERFLDKFVPWLAQGSTTWLAERHLSVEGTHVDQRA